MVGCRAPPSPTSLCPHYIRSDGRWRSPRLPAFSASGRHSTVWSVVLHSDILRDTSQPPSERQRRSPQGKAQNNRGRPARQRGPGPAHAPTRARPPAPASFLPRGWRRPWRSRVFCMRAVRIAKCPCSFLHRGGSAALQRTPRSPASRRPTCRPLAPAARRYVALSSAWHAAIARPPHVGRSFAIMRLRHGKDLHLPASHSL